jgi:hypothetical protein
LLVCCKGALELLLLIAETKVFPFLLDSFLHSIW